MCVYIYIYIYIYIYVCVYIRNPKSVPPPHCYRSSPGGRECGKAREIGRSLAAGTAGWGYACGCRYGQFTN